MSDKNDSNSKSMDNAAVVREYLPSTRREKGNGLTRRKDVVKRAIVYHLSGLGGKGLAYRALERLAVLVDNPDPQIALTAIDKIVKLLPYAISKEDLGISSNPNSSTQPINIQINFDQQMRNRLQGTHFQGLMENLIGSQNPSESE